MRGLVSILAAGVLITSRAPQAEACTTVRVEQDGAYVGKSYDWSMGHGLVVVNKRGAKKRALPMQTGSVPAEWTSRYASVTFNQYAVELPNGGMNEAGLVVEVMWLDGSRAPDLDERPALSELEWIQYQLDNFGTVEEMVAHASDVRVAVVYGRVHYLACDRKGACAAFEHLDGELVLSHGPGLPLPVLTNTPYRDALARARTYDGLGGTRPMPVGRGSTDRFVRAAWLAGHLPSAGRDAVRDTFTILDSVRQPGLTRWQIVYDTKRLRAHFRTSERPELRSVDLSSLDPSCTSPRRVLDLEAAGSELRPYSSEVHRALVRRSTAAIERHLPAGAVALLAAHPDDVACAAP